MPQPHPAALQALPAAPERPAASRQQGIALLMVLVIVAIATVLTVGMISAQQQTLRRAGSLFAQDQARLYDAGAEEFIKELIQNDTDQDRQSKTPRDNLAETWAQPFPPFPVDGGVITARLTDAQARFNLNSLVQGTTPNQGAVHFFQRLLRAQGYPDTLVYGVIDWEDSDNQPINSDGAEDDYYSRLTPPYRAANQPFASVSELLLVRGFTPDMVRTLSPYLVALPQSTPMNINTMGPVLMQSLVDGLSPTAGQEIVRMRPLDGYKSVQDFLSQAVFNGLTSDAKTELQGILDIRTHYFEMTCDADIDERHSVMTSVIQRTDSGTLSIISRDYGLMAYLPPDLTIQNAATSEGLVPPTGM